MGDGTAAGLENLVRHRVGGLAVLHRVDHDGDAIVGEPLRRGAADVARGAGDDGDLAVQGGFGSDHGLGFLVRDVAAFRCP